jgi:phosphosulfolactate synthase
VNFAPYLWVEWIKEELEAGAWKVITEAREGGTAGIFRPTGEMRTGLIDEIVHEIDQSKLIFEAPRKHQQVRFIEVLGPQVNLGNVLPEDALSLETLRLGLRADTLKLFHEK